MKTRSRLVAGLATLAVAAATPVVAGGGAGADPQPHAVGPGYDLLFVRHAHTTYPVPEQELSPLGIQQANTLVDFLADEDIRSVDSSIMVRTYQTADGVAADHDVPVLADEDIREVEFDLEGIPQAQWNAKIGPILASWLHGEERDNGFGGESYYDVQERWDRWWTQYVREHRDDKGTGVVVAHGAIFAIMLPTACTNEVTGDFALQNVQSNTGIVKAHLNPNGTLICTEWNVNPATGVGVPVPSAP
ncbi:histidine phosphatase family protein [Nocardioides albidus]|uniref:Histidine phosphatase family protein n=1 Tax=Nocardioides albidus TaxID=1517589 RepID=A0A5C4VL78_9ACTN|nr:histidine phosphatase family protein [Nocardioides albidus]TNM36511.1 histidine phosphatase family protein [Nocardioides albidus]